MIGCASCKGICRAAPRAAVVILAEDHDIDAIQKSMLDNGYSIYVSERDRRRGCNRNLVRGIARRLGSASRSVSWYTTNHRPMRRGNSAVRPTIELTDVDYLAATRPLAPTHDQPVEWARTSRRPLDERTLLDELWRISHFGWIPERVIRRALTLARGPRIPTHGLHQGLRQLLARGRVEHHDGDANIEDHHWRLTESGRDARVH